MRPRSLAADIGSREQIVLTADGYSVQGLGGIIVHLHAAIVREQRQRGPAFEPILDRLGGIGFSRQLRRLAIAWFQYGNRHIVAV